MSSSLDAFIGKLDRGAQNDLSELHGTCWDEDEAIIRCRTCRVEFSLMVRKHHCRSCGGIYCASCNPAGAAEIIAARSPAGDTSSESGDYYVGKYVGRKDPRRKSFASDPAADASECDSPFPADPDELVPMAKEEGFWFGKYLGRPNPKSSSAPQLSKRSSEDGSRYCIGCRMAETPCERVKTILKDRYVNVMSTRSEPRPPSEQLTLRRGSLYGETSKVMQRTDGKPAHTRGYLEILNKGDFVFCVKMFTGQSDIYRESSRPSYLPVFPEEVVYVEVGAGIREVDMAVLYGNKERPVAGQPVVRSVREYLVAHPGDIPNESVVSPCAIVDKFPMIVLYTIDMDGKNAILKYQGQGVVEIRKGTTSSLARGAGQMLKGVLSSAARAQQATLDMNTNTDTLIEVFRCDRF